ncbi:MAG: hypothetical protein ACXVY8_05990, partial [Gaiellaceae bacterium]
AKGEKGDKGDAGETGPQGPAGAGLSSLGQLSGIGCNMKDSAGVVVVTTAADGTVTLHCHVDSPPPPAAELCNGIDDDHDGTVDEDFPLKGEMTPWGGIYVCSPDGKGVVPNAPPPAVDWGNLEYPLTIQARVGEQTTVYGHVWVHGLTDYATGAPPFLQAQLGACPKELRDNPSAWAWIDATFSGNVENGRDEFSAPVTFGLTGSYEYLFRYSTNGGASWRYGESDGLHAKIEPGWLGEATVS